jgi:hypothetical protein
MRVREVGIVLRNLLMGGHLSSLSLAGQPTKMVFYLSECLFLKKCIQPNGGLKQRAIWDTFASSPVPIQIHGDAANEWCLSVGSFMSDLVSLCSLSSIEQPKVIFEIGTLHGTSALHLASNSRGAEVYTLDLPPDGSPALPTTLADRSHNAQYNQRTRIWFDGRPEAERIHRLFGDSANFDFSPYRGKVDFFFIDGAHSYEYVRSDTFKALECTHPGSVIAWHDYGRVGFNGVTRWLHEFARQGHSLYRVPGGSLAYMRV